MEMGVLIKSVHKKFSQASFEENDFKARQYTKKLFREHYQMEVIDNPDKYGIDLFLLNDDKSVFGYCDCEIKWYLQEDNWKNDKWKYDTLRILYRKKKYAEEKDGNPVLFCLFSPDGSRLAMVRGSEVLRCPVLEVKNRAVSEGEMFFDVPLNKVRMLCL